MTQTISPIETIQDFIDLVQTIETRPEYRRPVAFAVGVATVTADDHRVLDVRFPVVNLQENYGTAAALADSIGHERGTEAYVLRQQHFIDALSRFKPFDGDGEVHHNIDALKVAAGVMEQNVPFGDSSRRLMAVAMFIQNLDHPPVNAIDVYLRLHLLSHRKMQPKQINLDGAFGLLANVAWTDQGPILAERAEEAQMRAIASGERLKVYSVDKFPQMVDFVIPSGVRIADGARVRLGAHLAEGTTVMHEGFVNFNAGTLGPSMVEGRISMGVVVGNDSDIGGGASIMGTLSGGGKEVISIGKNCLLGANSGTGISLGDNCVIEAGLYVTAGTMVTHKGLQTKALEYSGQSNLLFRRNSLTGQVEVLLRKSEDQSELNAELHAN